MDTQSEQKNENPMEVSEGITGGNDKKTHTHKYTQR